MGFIEYSTIFFLLLIFISFLVVLYRSQNKNSIIPTNWPVVGMIPAAIVNYPRAHDYVTDVLACTDGTFLYKGPWLANMDMLFTANPSDIHHIMSKNFLNYPKGDKFRKMFEVFGDGIINADGELWEFHRKTIMMLLKIPTFQSFSEKTTWNKVERGLMPILEYVSEKGVEIDLQEIFERFTFDNICTLLFDYDPQSLSLDFPYIPCEKALTEMGEAILLRYITPPSLWKLQQLLRIGHEKKLSDAWKTLDHFIYKCLSQKQKESSNMNNHEEKFILSTAFMREFKDQSGSSGDPNKFLRDELLTLMVAGRDTTSTTLSWFFYLLAKNPVVEDKIREELQTVQLGMEMDGKWNGFHGKELCKLVYLHGALSEALRLYSPVPLQNKTPLQQDILPSGHKVDHKTTIVLSYYSMGRMKSIWGDDCMEFKPERWVSMAGGINHQPSYKFPAFNAGPRTCLGKDMSFTQMKIVAATIIYHYHVELVEGHRVVPSGSIILQMKNGLKVRLTKRGEVKSE